MRQDFGRQIVFKKKYNSEYDLVGMDIIFNASIPPSWLEAIDHFSQPAAAASVAGEVTRLKFLSASRNEVDADFEMRVSVLTEELSVFPIDIVREVCRTWARTKTFFPTSLKEVIDQCRELMLLRSALKISCRGVRGGGI